MSFRSINKSYENWLRKQSKVVEKDLRAKHKRMQKDAFVFLRATFFRWAGTIESICPDLADAPSVLSIGDTHVENFGSWRDWEGRLIWGANDFDEAAGIPYPFDLVRLATSARLAPDRSVTNRAVSEALLDGYAEGLNQPAPFVLDERWGWLLKWLHLDAEKRADFWWEIDALETVDPPAPVRKALEGALQAKGLKPRFARRRAGGGSLGRPRFVAIASWQGGRIVREAKALVPSAWDWAHGRRAVPPRFLALAIAPYRAADPYLAMNGRFLVRRLAPDSQKAELGEVAGAKLEERLLNAMGREIGSLHAIAPGPKKAIMKDLRRRPAGWLHAAARKAADAVERDFEEWSSHG